MKPFNSDGCCRSVCLSASDSNLVSVFLCSSRTESLSHYSRNTHSVRGSQGRALGVLGKPVFPRDSPRWDHRVKGMPQAKEMLQEQAPLQKLSAKSNGCRQHRLKRTRGALQLFSSCNWEGRIVQTHKEGQEPPRAPVVPHIIPVWSEAHGALRTRHGTAHLRKGKEQSLHLVSGSVQTTSHPSHKARASSPSVPAKALHRRPQVSLR